MRELALIAVLALAGCAGAPTQVPPPGRPGPGAPAAPTAALPPPPEIRMPGVPEGATCEVLSVEAVASAADDQASFVQVFVDGKDAGATDVAPKSREKRWGAVLPVGNHLFRFRVWTLPLPGEWAPLPDGWQPPERFIRVYPSEKTLVRLKLSEGGRRHELLRAHAPLKP